jgi:hypothetical protein
MSNASNHISNTNNPSSYVTSHQHISPNRNSYRAQDHNNFIQPRAMSQQNIFNDYDSISSISQNSRYSLTENSQIHDF